MTAPTATQAGVVDIGSNSVRLVGFDLRPGIPLPSFNEKVICRLGEGVAKSGQLLAANVSLALESLERFAALAAALRLDPLYAIATAAVRDASNAADFVAAAAEVLGVPVAVLGGEEEARLSAQGVLAGFQDVCGVVADLGGGSLEVAEADGGRLGAAVSLGLGPLSLADLVGADRAAARLEIDRQLRELDWLVGGKPSTLYLVGGAWRALARVQMAWASYPLAVVHGYTLSKSEARALAARVARADPAKLAQLPGVARRRVESLPHAAAVLASLIEAAKPRAICFSAQGLREGLLFDRLAATSWATDPLLTAADWVADRSDLSPEAASCLAEWTRPLFPDETVPEGRLRRVACQLSNIAWREHPEYRDEHALEAILRLPVLPLDHAERAFLGLTLWHRHARLRRPPVAMPVQDLMPEAAAGRAALLGQALRLAYRLSGGAPDLLARTSLEVEDGALCLRLAPELKPGMGVARRLANLADEAGLDSRVTVG